jgi:hypothetical protein
VVSSVQRSESGDAVYLSAFKRTPAPNPESDAPPPVDLRRGVDGCSDDSGQACVCTGFFCVVLPLMVALLAVAICATAKKSLSQRTRAELCELVRDLTLFQKSSAKALVASADEGPVHLDVVSSSSLGLFYL